MLYTRKMNVLIQFFHCIETENTQSKSCIMMILGKILSKIHLRMGWGEDKMENKNINIEIEAQPGREDAIRNHERKT